ncbi:MAG TPA: general stress protein [Ktedonobacteraceae bacterium]
MSKEKRQALASLGGIASHIQGKAHTWTKAEASAAERKGGRNGTRKSKAHQRANFA